MPQEAVEFLADSLSRSNCFLEYGSGGSTRMAARAGIPHVFSVESDPIFARAVRRHVRVDVRALRKEISVSVIVAQTGETNQLGYPANMNGVKLWPEYPLSVWESMKKADVSPDLILIDGRFRVACLLTSIFRAAPGTPVLFDDYVGRETRYGKVE